MSALATIKLAQIKDAAMAVAAMQRMNPASASHIKQNATRRGFAAYREQHAAVVLGREFFSGVEDVGLVKDGDCYTMQYDADDRQRLANVFGCGTMSFSDLFTQYYTAVTAENDLKNKGYSTSLEKQPNGELRIRAMSWA